MSFARFEAPTGQRRNETEVERCYVVFAVGLGTETWLAKIACPSSVAKALSLPADNAENRGAAQLSLAGRHGER